MRIAYVCADPGVPVFGNKGSSIHVQSVVRALVRKGATVELFATRIGGPTPADLAPVQVHELPRPRTSDRAERETALLAANDDLLAALEEHGPFDLVYERYSLWSYAAMEYAAVNDTPGVLEVNAPLIDEQAQHRGLYDRAGAEHVADRVFGAASRLLAVSDGVASYLHGRGVAKDKVHVVPNGVDPARFPPNLAPTIPHAPNVITIGFVGTLKPWHGLPVLIDAFARLLLAVPNARLLLVGDGPERERLEADVAARHLSRHAYFCGAVAPDAIPGLLRSMDIAVAPYPALDQFYFSPLKVFEYMAAGVPVVASDIGQICTLITNNVDGLLCPPGDAAALAQTLARLCHNSYLRRRLGRTGRNRVMTNHTWDAVAEHILAQNGVGAV